MSKFEQREVNGPNNVGLFALEDIPKDTIISREIPFYSFSLKNLMHYMSNKNPTGNPDLDAEIRELQIQIQIANKKYHGTSSSFDQEYPSDARILLDRMVAIITENNFELESRDVQEKWLRLCDAHQEVRRDTTVGIFGLSSEKGKTFNGEIGHCRGFDTHTKRYIVECNKSSTKNCNKMLLKKQNLKTVSGVFRSNSFQEGLFENRCRMNHSCLPNTVSCTVSEYNKLFGKNLVPEHPNECATVAQENIKAGDELTFSYLFVGAGKGVKDRREELREKYKFECQCKTCMEEDTK